MNLIYAFLVLFVIERLRPLRFAHIPWIRPEFRLDAIYFVQNSLIRHGSIVVLLTLFWIYRWVLLHRLPVPAPLVSLMAWLISDLTVYAGHRWLHRAGVPWRIHLSHHSMKLFDSLASFRFHALEHLIYSTCFVCSFLFFVVYLRFPGTPFLLGYLFGGIWEIVIHSNLELSLERRWVRALYAVMISPQAHRLHHMNAYADKNFGNSFTLWDRVFGTYVSPVGIEPGEIGSVSDPALQLSFLRQVAHPFVSVSDS